MERLTDKNAAGSYFYPKCFEKCDGLGASSKCDNCEIMTSICEKLGKYEDLEECGKCSLVQDTDELLEMYDSVCDWLEELKAMRNLDKTNFSDGYNRGIDDFLKEADATFPMQNDGTTVLRRLEKIADRLKGGGSCE